MRPLVALAALVAFAALAGCGTETAAPDPAAGGTPVATPTTMPTEIPVPDGPVTTRYAVTVLDDGDGAELCLGGVLHSLPPQCGGPRLLGWDWGAQKGHYDERSGTRWGAFAVTGTFDGQDLEVTDVVPAAEAPPYPAADGIDLTSPCPEPEGGWQVLDPARTTQQTLDETMRAASRLDGFAGSWVDQSINPLHDDPDSLAKEYGMNDPTKLVVNVRVTGDPAAAEADLRKVWGGALCVTRAEHTERELRRIQSEVLDLPGMLGGGSGHDRVEVSVVFDDGSIQAWADREYGDGVVRVSSALTPVE